MKRFLTAVAVFSVLALSSAPARPQEDPSSSEEGRLTGTEKSLTPAPPGPLRVHPRNPRYFTDNSGKAIYLTGSHTWSNLHLKTDPRPAPGTKVSLLDTDHVFGVGGDQKWVWKAFLRGHNVLFMDPYDDPQWTPILAGQRVGVRDANVPRQAMGHTRRCAEGMDLVASAPRSELASTGYCLANPDLAGEPVFTRRDVRIRFDWGGETAGDRVECRWVAGISTGP